MAEDFLTEFERALKERTNQLSPEERKIQSKVNLDRMGKQQIDIRNAKAQAYLDKKAAEKAAKKAPSMASKAGRAFAQAEQGVKKALPKIAAGAKGVLPKLASVARVSAPVQAAIEATRTARFLADEDYRDVNQKAYEEMAEKPALSRALEGAGGGMATILTQAKNLLDTSGAYSRAAESREAAEEGKKRLIAKGILDEKGRPTRLRETAPEAESREATPQFDGEALSRALIEAAPVRPAEAAPDSGEVGAPRTPEVEAAYKEIEAGTVQKAPIVDESKLEAGPVELDEDRMAQLYRKTTGSVYNPEVSKAAREKMAQLKSFVSSNPDMLNKSDTRIALDFYRTL